MTTRLTKDMRYEIINSALRGTTYEEQKKQILAELKTRAAAFIASEQPAGWTKLIKGHPKEWFQQQAELSMDRDKNPVNAVRDQDLYGEQWKVALDNTISVAKFVKGSKTFDASCADLLQQAQALQVQRDGVRDTLLQFLNSCSSVEKVVERMPELAAHVPKVVKSFPLVAPSNALAMLTKMGFDQTVKK